MLSYFATVAKILQAPPYSLSVLAGQSHRYKCPMMLAYGAGCKIPKAWHECHSLV